MASSNSYQGLDPRVVAGVRHHARLAFGRMPGLEIEDLEQECLLHVWRRLDRFDPGRASLRTFVDRVVRNRLSSLIEGGGAAKRGARVVHLPFDAAEEAIGGCGVGIADDADANPEHTAMLRHDVRRALAQLPTNLLDLCSALPDQTVSELARASGTPRSTVYGRIADLRARLQAYGLGDYVVQRPAPDTAS